MRKSILSVPNPILRAKSIAVDPKKDASLIKKYSADLEETLSKKNKPKGVGLSMPQIGKNVRIFSTLLPPSINVADSGRPPKDDSDDVEGESVLTTYLNPVILETSKEFTFGPNPKEPLLEGCLSIPSIYGPVPRYTWVRLFYLTPDFKTQEGIFHGFFGRVIQHEFDHLEGILFTDYVLKHKLPLYEMHGKTMKEIDPNIAKSF
ncbi:MAG TPA: peptide deformylase [Candidatus Pacebacteria bacterium]|nr:MAG: Peptide deformylase [Microgenomates group bacterium GW2011_GWB1_45_17]KKU24220.1 MAG: Peptide deformylase [Microgenomates group bacterium GW2011_GWC1_46_15]KKU24936.1 MAG: Peptide deformylase [Microgenomates group bacterium GW2011_GWA1_46_15]HAV15331.1 peptide deformylase [Candidatus Paceibacterota bacterium]HCR11397.1 peptide deformylase [Candidatus Paceibacterota bacterium]